MLGSQHANTAFMLLISKSLLLLHARNHVRGDTLIGWIVADMSRGVRL